MPWGKDTSDHAVLKDATWVDHVTLVPRPGDAGQVKFFTQLRSRNNIDEVSAYVVTHDIYFCAGKCYTVMI